MQTDNNFGSLNASSMIEEDKYCSVITMDETDFETNKPDEIEMRSSTSTVSKPSKNS